MQKFLLILVVVFFFAANEFGAVAANNRLAKAKVLSRKGRPSIPDDPPLQGRITILDNLYSLDEEPSGVFNDLLRIIAKRSAQKGRDYSAIVHDLLEAVVSKGCFYNGDNPNRLFLDLEPEDPMDLKFHWGSCSKVDGDHFYSNVFRNCKFDGAAGFGQAASNCDGDCGIHVGDGETPLEGSFGCQCKVSVLNSCFCALELTPNQSKEFCNGARGPHSFYVDAAVDEFT